MKTLMMMCAVLLSFAAPTAAQTPAPAKAPDVSGQWTATFESPVGTQSYTYDFVVAEGKLTGKIKGSLSEAPSDVHNGKIEGSKITFEETLTFMGMEIKISYTGTIASADEIKFTRNVADFGSEDLVAKRVRK